ncbi:hypothetical protein FGW37_21605 [Streptomyces rectiverticillatus]|uniref:hypothetical protein n=1 Tax=Streptomyces rectiverticillatus TaxID=173860 RepID=UPI0015C3FF7D|nr:hypothetical protein [Streptomyces rectiverticillatus]QLE73831.1 hypothetical protein FGW37_21605 [Streptomyces rectiverticillatus]
MTTHLRDGSAPAAAGIAAPRTDPVKALLHRHHGLCARAVDPLEIAAVLEDGGLTDRAAAECRHRDVFSLSDELYARAEREEPARPAPGTPCEPAALAHTLRAPWRCAGLLAGAWLVAYALLGGPVLAVLLSGHAPGLLPGGVPGSVSGGVSGGIPGHASGPALVDSLRAAAPVAVALACGLVPALWCARWFTGRVRHALVASRSRAEFRARAWPLLLMSVGLFTAILATLLWSARAALGAPAVPPGELAAVTALGGLLFLARLLTARGFGRTAAVAVLTACGVEAAALAAAALGVGAPGAGPFAAPSFAAPAVAWAAGAYGPAAIPLVACVLPALALLAHALTALSRASAHRCGAFAPVPADPGEAPARAR